MKVLAAVLLLSVFGITGCGRYEDAKQQKLHYYEMVKAGYWPAYNESINC